MRIQLKVTFEQIVSSENLLEAWQEFIRGKRNKQDVQVFSLHLMDNLAELHLDLVQKTYKHGAYHAFSISDPKPRNIHKASVRDRVLHHAIYRKLYPFFDHTFIADSYSCRNKKGTHKALERFAIMSGQVSANHTKTCWVLKCDITKFFASINQEVLFHVLSLYIPDQNILWLLQEVVTSFSTKAHTGLPLGNLTSQLLVNVYMNQFDQYVKHAFKSKHYIRYADDFVLLSDNREWLEKQVGLIQIFLEQCLLLSLHPHKVSIQTLASGVDFLGWVHFPTHRVLRTTTKKRMERRLQINSEMPTLASYLGMLSHGDTQRIRGELLTKYWQSST